MKSALLLSKTGLPEFPTPLFPSWSLSVNSFFQNTLSSGQWAILAMVPPAIVALYFLKLKRMPLEVPSTYLWKRSIEDMHVNSLWQRLRRSLLLFLQLLLVALAMLALLRPGWQGSKLEGQRFIFLIDNSASMSATDVEGVENRLAEARRLAGDLIDQMESGMTAMIVSFADTPQVVQEFTDNRRLLRERLATLGPTVRGTDLHGALDLADGLANPSSVMAEEDGQEYDVVDAQEATLYIFSDGRFEDVKDFSLGNLQPVYVPIGSYDATNLAIVAFTTRRSEAQPESLQAFVQVANYGDGPQTVIVELLLEGQFLDAQEMEIGPHETGSMLFPLGGAGGGDASARRLGSLRAGASSPPASGGLKARLKYTLANKPNSDNDALSIDDAAYAAMNAPKPGQVLVVSPGNPTLEVALATLRVGRLANIRFATPDLLKTADYQRDAEAGSYRLILFDRCAPAKMPRANTLFLGHLPPGDAWQSDSATGTRTEPKPTVKMPQIIDWNRAHPLLAHVELGNVDIAESLVVDLPSGGDSLIDSTAGPIGVIAPRGSFEDVLIGFEIVGTNEAGERTANTNWPRRHSFPTFWLNVMTTWLAVAKHTGQTLSELASLSSSALRAMRAS